MEYIDKIHAISHEIISLLNKKRNSDSSVTSGVVVAANVNALLSIYASLYSDSTSKAQRDSIRAAIKETHELLLIHINGVLDDIDSKREMENGSVQ